MSAWKRAPAIVALQVTLDVSRPGRRDKWPDGTIGDVAHMKRGWPTTDHAPDPDGDVCAVDVHDSDELDDGELYESIKVAGRQNPIKYAINNGRIWSPERGEHAYHGLSMHPDHCHVSVTQAEKHSTRPWVLPGITDRVHAQSPAPQPLEEFVMASKAEVEQLLDEAVLSITGGVRVPGVDPDKKHVSNADVLQAVKDLADNVDARLRALEGKK